MFAYGHWTVNDFPKKYPLERHPPPPDRSLQGSDGSFKCIFYLERSLKPL
jgi:hypothetical protein